jgi:hypothetical protein
MSMVDRDSDDGTAEDEAGPSGGPHRRLGTLGSVTAGLAATLLLSAPPRPQPFHGGDQSWMVGINAARSYGLRFGSDLDFTYGPYGFLDNPMPIDRTEFIVAFCFQIAAVVVLWLAIHPALRRWWGPGPAAAAATVVTVTCAAAAAPSVLLIAGSACHAIVWIAHRDSRPARFVEPAPLATAALGALLVQIKVSDGLALLAIAVICAGLVPGWGRRARNLVGTAVVFSGSFLVLWVIVGGAPGDIPAWLHAVAQIAGGYPEAMNTEDSRLAGAYPAAALVAVAALVLVLRYAWGRPRLDVAAMFLVTGVALGMSAKEAFTRHDLAPHQDTYFAVGLALLCLLAGLSRSGFFPRLVILGALAGLLPALVAFEPLHSLDPWQRTLREVASPGSARSLESESKAEGRAVYDVPPAMLREIGRHPIGVDPVDAALAVDYDLNWHPVPVFLSYTAYTAYLDDLNAQAAIAAPPDQYVLRRPDVVLDDRNPLWETPRYLLTLACRYREVAHDARYTLLRHSSSRCSPPTPLGTSRLAPGQAVSVPDPEGHGMVVASFHPEDPSLLDTVTALVFKPVTRLMVTVDGSDYRLPRALAPGPLVVSSGTKNASGGVFPEFGYPSITFSMAGTVTFAEVSRTD